MADLIRPELRAQLRRFADLSVALVVAGLGLWVALSSFGYLAWVGWALTATGSAMGWAALQRLRFQTAGLGGGPGMIQVVEGEIRHFGPLTGGFIALEEIDALHLSPDGRLWLIDTMDGQRHALARDASGAEALFDAFATLPGLSLDAVLQALGQAPFASPRRLWTRPRHARLSHP